MSHQSLAALYFSPTGATRRAAQNIAAGTGLPSREIDRTSVLGRRRAHHFAPDDLVIIAMPVYGGRLPRVTGEVFAGITADRTPAAIAVLYGNRHYDDALLELKNAAIGKGFAPIAAGAFIGEHSYSRKVAAGRPDSDDARAHADFGRRFLAKAQADACRAAVGVPGRFPYEKPVSHSRITPVTGGECVNCRTCVEGCPMGAISIENPRVVDGEKCISCCYCVKVCPRGARRMEDPRILAVINRIETLCAARREAEVFF